LTALCGGGTSGPKPLVQPTVVYGSGAIAAAITAAGAEWAVLVAPLLAVLAVETLTLCSTDPPPSVALSEAEHNALTEGTFDATYFVALGKLKDQFLHAVWFDLCECTSGPQPIAPTNLFPPPINVTVQVPYGNCPAPRARTTSTLNLGGTGYQASSNRTQQFFPGRQTYRSGTNTIAGAQDVVAVDPSWVGLAATMDWVSGSASGANSAQFAVIGFGPDLLAVTSLATVTASQQFPHQRYPATGFATLNRNSFPYIAVTSLHISASDPDGVIDGAIDFNCSGAGAGSGCCPPDPTLQGTLDQILTQLTLLQRFSLPFSYVASTAHNGLTGTGSLPIGRSIGLRLDVTQFPAGNKQFLGEPPYIFDLGWVSVLTPDGMLDEIRLTRVNTSWLSKLIPSSTVVGWGLRDGVTLNITELRAES
jgi:hypothetical protein